MHDERTTFGELLMQLQPKPCVEALESRTLLSAWSTVDDFQLAPGGNSGGPAAITSDAAGNVYAAGIADQSTDPSNPPPVAVVREKPNGSTDWQTIAVLPWTYSASYTFNALTVDGAGNLYIGGEMGEPGVITSAVWEISNGGSATSLIDSFHFPDSTAGIHGVAVDSAGDVYAVGYAGSTDSGPHWIVRERRTGESSFATVDDFPDGIAGGRGATGITIIDNGPSAGIYVLGEVSSGDPSHRLVCKSTDGGESWSTVDDLPYNPVGPNGPSAVCHDQAGRVYVAGSVSGHWTVRASANGGASWNTIDDYQLSPTSPQGVFDEASAIGADLLGDIYAVGTATDAAGLKHSIIRSNASGHWETVDDFQLEAGQDAVGRGFAVDSDGNLYAGVQASQSAQPYSHWLIRSAPASILRVTLEFNYLVALAQHYNGPGTFTTGDLNGDGTVDFDDLVMLAANYGKTVSPSDFAPATAAPSGSSTVFSPAPVASAAD